MRWTARERRSRWGMVFHMEYQSFGPCGEGRVLLALARVGEGLAVELADRGVGVGHREAIGAFAPQARSSKPLGSEVTRVEHEHIALVSSRGAGNLEGLIGETEHLEAQRHLRRRTRAVDLVAVGPGDAHLDRVSVQVRGR